MTVKHQGYESLLADGIAIFSFNRFLKATSDYGSERIAESGSSHCFGLSMGNLRQALLRGFMETSGMCFLDSTCAPFRLIAFETPVALFDPQKPHPNRLVEQLERRCCVGAH